tara:strand:+ start:56 stop:673 length:618 start_codon:yes stop_codon:yes gene_type:complete
MKTMTIRKNSGSSIRPGWKTVTISRAKYETYEGNPVLDLWFEDLPENMNTRVYSKKGHNGEEFVIAQVFRFANAGLTESLTSANGDMVVQFDDTAENLVGHEINIYLHKDPKNTKYNRVLRQFAPTVFKNDVESFDENDVEYWKGRAEDYYRDYILKTNGTTNGFLGNGETHTEETHSDDTLPLAVQGGPADTTDHHTTKEEIPF